NTTCFLNLSVKVRRFRLVIKITPRLKYFIKCNGPYLNCPTKCNRSIVPEHDILMRGFRQTEKLREDLIDSTKEELKRLSRKIERLDENYYRKLRKLNESEK